MQRASAIGWSLLAGAAGMAALSSPMVQLTFAVVAIGIVGMLHGASDLAIVERRLRVPFLGAYGLIGAACLGWWIAEPAMALPAFLIASAVHFGLEDATADKPIERIARGISLVATPAALHGREVTQILRLAGTSTPLLPDMARSMIVAGGLAAVWLLVRAGQRRDTRLGIGTVALLFLPPLVGFSVGFLILHALPQTIERRRQLGCTTMGEYLCATARVLGAAIGVVTVVGLLLLRLDPSGIRSLFAGIAALAVPHLIVTPAFASPKRRGTEVAPSF